MALFWASCLHPSRDGHSLPCRAAFSLFRPSSVPTNQVVRFGSSWRAWISAHSCLSINSSDASRDGFIPATASREHQRWGEMSSEVYWDIEWIRLSQGLAGEHQGHSGCSPHTTPHPPQRWALLPPCGFHHQGRLHGAPTVCLRAACPPAALVLSPGDGGSLGMWVGTPGA